MVRVNDVYKYLAEYAPLDMKMDFDNPGFLVGRGEDEVTRVLTALDITDEVVSEAADIGAQLIVSHHPLFFSLKSVTDSDRTGRKIVALISSGISAICMHTNLDAAKGGVNDALARAAGIVSPAILNVEGVNSLGEQFSYGRVGNLSEPVPMSEYLPMLKAALSTGGLRYHDAGRPVYKVGVIGGSGGGMMDLALAQGCDTFVTADVKYDTFLAAKELGINLIDGDHFCTENLVTPVIAELKRGKFPELDVRISERHGQTAKFI